MGRKSDVYPAALAAAGAATWLVLTTVCSTARGQLPDDFQLSQFAAGAQPLALLDGLSRLGSMSQEERHEALSLLGEFVKGQLNAHCNVFGGREACVDLAGTELAAMCPGLEPRVDCLYYSEDMLSLQQTPVDRFKQDLAERGVHDLEQYCPECLDNLHQTWCTQALPKCGTFDALLDHTIFPAVQQLQGDSAGSMPQDWADEFSRNVSVLLPCREMCDAVVNTCGCGKQKTFGDIVASLVPGGSSAGAVAAPLLSALEDAWRDKGVCELFAYRGEHGFQGHCVDLKSSCHRHDEWCSREGGEEGAQDPEQLILGPVVRAIFGWDDASKDDPDRFVVHAEAGTGDTSGSGGSTAVVVLAVLLALALAALAAIGGVWYWQNHVRRDQLEYVSLVELNDHADPL